MRRSSLLPAFFWIAFAGVSGQAMGAESRHMSANGGESCPETTSTGAFRGTDAEPEASAPATPAKRSSRPTAAPRASEGNRSTAPRWHSFLPGMFR